MRASPGHLGDLVSAYVDRTLPSDLQRRLDRHLVTCRVCAAAADAERRLLTSLRGARTPGVPSSLTAALRDLAVARSAAPRALAVRPDGRLDRPSRPLPLVAQRAPALHRSPVRAALLAGLAAGASAAAAWGIGATGAVTARLPGSARVVGGVQASSPWLPTATLAPGASGLTATAIGATGTAGAVPAGPATGAAAVLGGVLIPAVSVLAAPPVTAVTMGRHSGPGFAAHPGSGTFRSGRQSRHD